MFLKRSYSVRDVDSNFVRVETDPKLKQILKGYMFKSQTLSGAEPGFKRKGGQSLKRKNHNFKVVIF